MVTVGTEQRNIER